MSRQIELRWQPLHIKSNWGGPFTDPHIWIDLARFDREWRRDDFWVGPGGVPGGQGRKYPKIGTWIYSGGPIDMCQIWINHHGMGFIDGRHRFAWLRDHGVEAMPVQLSPESLGFGASPIETALRKSILTVPDDPRSD